MGKKFELSRWAVLSAFDEGTGKNLNTKHIKHNADGNVVCVPCREESANLKGFRAYQIGFEWQEPRDITGVRIGFDRNFDYEDIDEVYIQYWKNSWPDATPEHRAGALRGWMSTDDAFNGRFKEAFGEIKIDSDGVEVVFDHIDISEFGGSLYRPGNYAYASKDYNAFFRRTLKIRAVFISRSAPVISSYEIIGDADVCEKECVIYQNVFGSVEGISLSEKDISVYNGEIKNISGDGTYSIKYTATENPNCDGDRTSLCLETKGLYPFSIYDSDIDKGVYLKDYDILVCRKCEKEPRELVNELVNSKAIFDKITDEPEQTLERAFRDIPEMDVTKQQPFGRYVILGWEGLRKKFCLKYNGEIFSDKTLSKCTKRDLKDTLWAGSELHYKISTGDPAKRHINRGDCTQSMPDARIPVYVTEWFDRDIEYTQTSFCIPKDLSLIGKTDLKGDEDIIVLNRVDIRNASDTEHTARLYIEPSPSEKLELSGSHLTAVGRVLPDDTVEYGWKIQKYPRKYMRLDVKFSKGEVHTVPQPINGNITLSMRPGQSDITTMHDGRRMEFNTPTSIATTLLYEVELAPFECARLDYAVPFNTPAAKEDMDNISNYDFEECLKQMSDFWTAFADKSAKISLPDDKRLNDFIKAVPWHITMTAMRDTKSGNYIIPAATYTYSACGNEACMQIRLMDYLGYHDYAEKYLEGYIQTQGMGALDGNFKTQDGVFFATNYGGRGTSDDEFSYNLDHGYILSCFADHYFLTGDKEWLARIAPNLIKGCEFIFREREATKINDARGEKVCYYGLLPHGHLEDNAEWRCWFAVNAHMYGGIVRCIDALREINHPECNRLIRMADDYKEDILFCIKLALKNSPAVGAGDGSFIPHLPTRCELRGRDLGWFREAAYGPLHLVYGKVLDADEKLTEWILRDLEDNLFISKSHGRIADREKNWFSHGGVTIQSNLLFNDFAYLERNEPEKAIRTLFNNFAVNLYRDLNCFTEHAVPEFGHGIGPFFKTPDESQFLCFLRCHLIREADNTLFLLQGAPRTWFEPGKEISFTDLPSFFGKISLSTETKDCETRINIAAKSRKTPYEIKLFVRDSKKRTATDVFVNGKTAEIKDDVVTIKANENTYEIFIKY